MDFCKKTATIWQLVGNLILILKIVIPLLIILFASIDFGKAIASSEDKVIKEKAIKLIKRILAGVVIFFIPLAIKLVFSLISSFNDEMRSDFGNCITCLTDPNGECDTSYQGTIFTK